MMMVEELVAAHGFQTKIEIEEEEKEKGRGRNRKTLPGKGNTCRKKIHVHFVIQLPNKNTKRSKRYA